MISNNDIVMVRMREDLLATVASRAKRLAVHAQQLMKDEGIPGAIQIDGANVDRTGHVVSQVTHHAADADREEKNKMFERVKGSLDADFIRRSLNANS